MGISNPLNAIMDNQDNVFEHAKAAVGDALSNAMQSTVGQETLKLAEKPLNLLSKAAVPYRDYVAPTLTAFLMEANSSYREQNKDLSVVDQIIHARDMAKQSVAGEPDWRRSISPGRALVGLIGNMVPGTQGTDKLNWEDSKQVNHFFNSGSAQFYSGLADVGFNTLDPVLAIGKGFKLAKQATLTREVGTFAGDLGKLIPELKTSAADPLVQNGISPFFELVEKDATDVTTISKYGFVAASSNPVRLATAISQAYQRGGREGVADIVGASMGHFESLDKIAKTQADLHEQLLANNQTTKKIQNDIESLDKIYYSKGVPTVDEYIAYSTAQKEYVKQLTEADNKTAEIEKNLSSNKFPLKEQGAIQQTWSKSNFVERVKASSASIQRDGIIVEVDGSKKFSLAREVARDLKKPNTAAVRTALWFAPNTQLREAPAGIAWLGGAAGERSHAEADARIRNLARAVNMSADNQRALQNEYRVLESKSARNNWFNNFQEQSINMLLEKHYGDKIGKMTTLQQEAATAFAKELVESTVRAQIREKKSIFDPAKEYTVVDDLTGNHISHAYLDDLIEKDAALRAEERGSGTVSDSDRAAARRSMTENPLTETQVPNMHFGIDVNFFDQVMSENPALIGNVMNGILEKNYDKPKILEFMKSAEASAINGSTGFGATYRDVISPMARTVGDIAVEGLDTFYTYVWKPATLMSLKYTTRNIGEGWLRIMASMLEFRSNYGYAWSDMFSGLHDPGSVARTIANRKYRKSIRQSSAEFSKKNAEWRASEEDISKQINAVTSTGQKIVNQAKKTSIDAAQKHEFENTDGMTMSLHWIKSNYDHIRTYKAHGNPAADAAVDDLNNKVFDTVFSPKLKEPAAQNFIDAILDGKYQLAHDISVSSSSESIARGVSDYSAEVRKALAILEKHPTTGAPSVDATLDNVRYGLERLNLHADNTSGILIKRGELRDELDAITSKTQIIGGKTLSFSKKNGLEIHPGVFIDQSLAGKADDMLRNATSSRASTTGLLANDRNVTGYSFLSAGYARRNVNRSDSAWAQAHADYVNNVLMRDSVARRIVESMSAGKTSAEAVDEAKSWIREGSADAIRWKSEIRQNTVERAKSLGISTHDPNRIIDEINLQIEQYLPSVNSDTGALYTDLYKKAIDGFHVDDSLSIAFRDRHDVMAATEIADKSATTFYKNAVSKIFQFVGTLPEDHLARHPFFNMVHDAEAKRLRKSIVAQGKAKGMSEQQITDMVASRAEAIKATAVNKGFKELMTRLYSVERYTDPARVLRFVTPFFMAMQNSSRFWLGTSLRNPDVAYMLAKIYNAPYRGGYVQNDKGELVPAGHPWSKNANKQRVTGLLPGMEFSPTGIDVIFQGQVPMLPSLGAPGAGVITAEALKKAAKNDKIVSYIQNTTGMTLDEFTTRFIMPFYVRQGDRSVAGNIVSSAIPLNSWMISGAAAMSKGNFPVPQVQERWLARVDEARKQVVADDLMNGAFKSREQIQKDSIALAQKSLILEATSSFTGPVVAGKVKYATLEKLRNRQNVLIQANNGNYNKALIQLTQEYDNKGFEFAPSIVSVLNSSSTNNRYGFVSNTKTLNGIVENLGSLQKADYHYTDNPFIGELFNIPSKDNNYSPIADDAMFGVKINGKPIKSRDMTQAESNKQQTMRAAWAMYFHYVDYINKDAEKNDVQINSPKYKQIYSPVKGAIEEYVKSKFPVWDTKQNAITLHKSDAFVSLAHYFLNDKKYMSTVGKANPSIKGLKLYMEAREVISAEFQSNAKRTGYSTLTSQENQKYADVMAAVSKVIIQKYPGFNQMYSRYLVQDELNPIDTTILKKGA